MKSVYKGEKEPSKCIWCGSEAINAQAFDSIEGSSASRFVDCDNCGGDWVEVFFFGELITGEPPDRPRNVPMNMELIATE